MALESFLKTHVINNDTKTQITHTEFGKWSKRSFHIPLEDEEEFENLYYNEIIKPKKNHNLIERQFIKFEKKPGPFLIDIDFRFSPENVHRLYSFKDHIEPFLQEYLAEIARVFELDEDTRFPVYVQEKPAPRNVIKGNESIIHDGFHILFGLAADQVYHEWLRNHMLEKIPDMWSELPIVNADGWEDVFDNSIPSGTNGWLKYGSKKAEDVASYKVTHAFECSYDFENKDWIIDIIETENEDLFLEENYRKLSARYRHFPTVLCKESMITKIKLLQNEKERPKSDSSTLNQITIDMEDRAICRIPIEALRTIKNKEDLDHCITWFLDNLNASEYELRETYEYTMALPISYYGPGSYNKWIRVGFALKNKNTRLLIVFLAFSAKCPNFQYSVQINDICDRWEKFDLKNHGLTQKSIMYWAKSDAPDEYEKVRENTIDYQIDQTIMNITLEQLNDPRKKNAKGSSDYDIATVLHRLCGDEFVSVSIKGNEWYQFKDHRWVKNDSGTTLRNMISTKLRDLYHKKTKSLWSKLEGKDPESEEYKLIYGRAGKVLDITFTLGTTKDKDNILKEAKEIFYNPEFLDKLDQNKYLMCFNNGVIDFKTKIFRKGYPEDYISKCTEMDYIPLNPSIDQPIIQELKEYMSQLFPESELCEYVWKHLASCLIGDTALNQCLHYYTGVGQNGKSMLVKLMQLILGTYAGDLDVGFYTQERSKRGQSTPELFAIIGVRYAITSEPSEGDKMNEGPMKQLTSGTDPMSCRAPYGQLMKFVPQANAIIMANHFLEIKSRDHGTWRRVRVVEFKSLFTDNPVKNDKEKPYQFQKVDNLDDKFAEWKTVFMGLLVELAFQTGGICKVCPAVTAASNQYRANQDFLAEFMNEKITKDTLSKIRKNELCLTFNSWYHDTYGSRVNKSKELYACMDRVYGACRNNYWYGVKIIYERDENQPCDISVRTDIEEEDEMV
jgi:P4 family phage/plasmid primase-like protien